MKRKQKSLHERAVRLVEGGIVQVDGHAVRAVKAPINYHPCDICNMDSLCHIDEDTDMAFLCAEVDKLGRDCYYLKLVETK